MSVVPAPPLPVRRSRVRTLLRYGLITLLVLGAGIFFARRQIGNLLARTLDERLSAAGIYVTWETADWVPGPGIRLRGLALFRDAAKRDRIALFGNMKAIKGDRTWDRWDRVLVNIADSRLTLGNGADETNLEHLEMRLLIEPGKAELQEFHASLQGLRIEAKGAYARAPAAAPANPGGAAKPAAPHKGLFDDLNLEGLRSVKRWVQFQPDKDQPLFKVEFQSLPDGRGIALAAALDGTKFQWQGQKWDLVQAAVKTSVGDKLAAVEIEQVRIGHAGRTAELKGLFDPESAVLRISKLESGVDVLALARALAPAAVGSLTAVTTTGDWHISGAGELPINHPENSQWSGSVELDGDLGYAADGTRLALRKPAFALHAADQVVSITGFKAGLWEGNLDLPLTEIHLPTADTKPRFDTQVALNGARLQSAVDSFSTAQRQPGVVHLDWKGGGGFELGSIVGSGSLSIHDAEFFRIPLLGPLHLVFDQLTPGFGKDVASSMTAGHRIGGGTLHIDNLKLESKLTRIEANGSVDLSRRYAHLTAKAKLQGIAGMTTALLSALLEIEGQGPTNGVHWKLKNVPGLEMIGDAASAVGKTGGKVLEGAGDAVKGGGKAARGLLKIPGKLLPFK